MNKKNTPKNKGSYVLSTEEEDEKFVKDYLMENNNFFKRNKDLINKLSFTHDDIGDSKSLIELQNANLKKSLDNYERKFSLLLNAAENNEKIYVKLIDWLVALIKSKKISINSTNVIELLAVNFEAKLVGMFLLNHDDKDFGFKKELLKYELKNDHPLNSHFKKLSEITFKQIPSKESNVLLNYFYTEGVFLRLKQKEIKSSKSLDLKIESGSMVLIPLKNPEFANDIFGNLVIISDDKEKFESGKGIVFLNSIAQIFSSMMISKLKKR